MPYLKPPAFTRKVFNPLAMKFGIGGSAALTIVGRNSGEERSVPVIPVTIEGVTYVVSARGETEWAKNLREAGTCLLSLKGHGTTYSAAEVPVGESHDVITQYRKVAGRTVAPYWKKLPDDRDHPVFRLTAA